MIADSPYHVDEPVLTPGKGAGAGLVASLLMLLAILLLHPTSRLSVNDLLMSIARGTVPGGVLLRHGPMLAVGTAAYLLLGALLGLLYAVSQDRAPARVLVAVGAAYGFLIWLGSRAVSSWFYGPVFGAMLRSFTWFIACLVYGAVLAGYAVWVDRRRPPASALAAPID